MRDFTNRGFEARIFLPSGKDQPRRTQHININFARDALNFSTWSKQEIDVDDIIDQIETGAMPKPIYLPLHPEANLTAEQKAQLIAGLRATFGG